MISRHENIPFQLQQGRIDLTRPLVPIFRIVQLLGKVKNGSHAVFPEKAFAFGNRGDVRRAAGILALLVAPEDTLHADPLGDHNVFWIDPFKI